MNRTALRWAPAVFAVLSASACYGGVTSGPMAGDLPSGTGGGVGADDAPADTGAPIEGGDSGEVVEPPPGVVIGLRGDPTYARFVRLTHDQWERGVRDLLRLSDVPGLAETFVPDPPLGKFPNNERRLGMTVELSGDYSRVAELLAVEVTSDPDALDRLTDGATDAASFVRDFGLRAFRRPLEPEEQQRYEALFGSAGTLTDNPDAFAGGVRLVVEAMLQSPNFLYRTELTAEGERLSGFELATKLSLFLRNTIPDDAMLAAAAEGRLDTAEGLQAEAERLLDMPDAMERLREFHSELFRTFRYLDIEKDPYEFPEFDPAMNEELLAADLRFFDHLYENGLGLHGLLLSTVAFVNQTTAPFYGVDASGPELTPVELGDRPGYLTRLGFLALNGTLREPDSIHRGVEVLKEIMCVEISPPAGEIPPLPPQEAGLTNRDRVTAHTGPGTCGASCHGTLINPIGFAFEHYDALGVAREVDNGLPVDASGAFRYGDITFEFSNAIEMLNSMADTPQAHACYAKHIAEFVLGRDLTEQDAAEIYALGERSAEEASLRELVLSVILSPSFATRAEGPQE